LAAIETLGIFLCWDLPTNSGKDLGLQDHGYTLLCALAVRVRRWQLRWLAMQRLQATRVLSVVSMGCLALVRRTPLVEGE